MSINKLFFPIIIFCTLLLVGCNKTENNNNKFDTIIKALEKINL
jgi:hypothetical protein